MMVPRPFSDEVIMNSITVENVYGPDANQDQETRLPGEEMHHGASHSARETSNPGSEDLIADRRRPTSNTRKNNVLLYGGVGMVALLMAGGYFLSRPTTINRPLPSTQSRIIHQVGVAPQGLIPLAPAATLANVQVKMPPASVHQKYMPQPPSTELSQLEQLQSGAQANFPPTPIGPAPNSSIVRPYREPLADTANPTPAVGIAKPLLQAVPGAPQASHVTAIAAHSPGTATPAPAPSGSPATALQAAAQISTPPPATRPIVVGGNPIPNPTNSITASAVPVTSAIGPEVLQPPPGTVTLAAAQAGALSSAQQTQLFQLVTDLATMERTDRINEAVLSGQVEEMSGLLTAKLADFDRRLSIQEAQNAVSGAMQAGSNAALTAAIAAPPAAVPSVPEGSSAPTAFSPPAATPASIPAIPPGSGTAVAIQYHVQAASPGLAMLSPVSGGVPLEAQVGDTIPGYGKVTGVIQQGDSWVVQTSSGNIE
jgi:hypothetical protein